MNINRQQYLHIVETVFLSSSRGLQLSDEAVRMAAVLCPAGMLSSHDMCRCVCLLTLRLSLQAPSTIERERGGGRKREFYSPYQQAQ